MASFGPLARTVRALVRPFTYMKSVPDLSGIREPVVFVSRHRNMRGPVFTLLHLPRDVHPWVLSVFCDPKSCYEQYTNYTLSVRLRWNNPLMRASARLLSRFVPALVSSAGGVPVYRRSVQIKRTFSQSLSALKRGESLIIYPDVNYMSTDDEMGEIYTGFLLLGQLYRREVGENLSFVPVDVDMRERALKMGRPVEFDGTRPFSKERDRVAEALRAEFTQLSITARAVE